MNDLVTPRKIWNRIAVTEVRYPFTIIKDEKYGVAIYKSTHTKSAEGFEFELCDIKTEDKIRKLDKVSLLVLGIIQY